MIAFSDLARISLRQVTRQRSYGVVFSIALGIMAFVTLSVLGREIRYNIGQDLVLMGGVNVIYVSMDDYKFPGSPMYEFFPETIDAVKKLPGVASVSKTVMGEAVFSVRVENTQLDMGFVGVDEFFWETFAANLISGRLIDAEDTAGHKRVCVLGREAARNIYGAEDKAVGKLLFLGNEIFEVVGVAGGVMMGSWGRGGFLPYTTVIDRRMASGKLNRLYVRAVAWEDVRTLVKEIPKVVLGLQDAPNMFLRTQDEQLDRIKDTFVWVEALLWLGITASLMLGGFGIWYGTFSAVRARTREVGLKKAMGGSDADILAQFLAEALFKAVAGGILGIVLGIVVVEIGSYMLHCSVPYGQLALSGVLSIVFSAVIGVGGGIYPAMQASRMDVVSALRFE